MPEPAWKVTDLFDSKEVRDAAFKRKLEKDFEIAAGHRTVKKIVRRHGKKTLYGYEVTRV